MSYAITCAAVLLYLLIECQILTVVGTSYALRTFSHVKSLHELCMHILILDYNP